MGIDATGAFPMNIAIAYLLTLIVFAVIDTAWLGSMGDRLYAG